MEVEKRRQFTSRLLCLQTVDVHFERVGHSCVYLSAAVCLNQVSLS